jgi:CysZ protein
VATAHQTGSRVYDPRSANPFHHFTHGLRFFFRGWPLLLRHPRLLGLSLIPIVLTLVILLTLAFGCAWLLGLLIDPGAFPFADSFRIIAQVLIFLLALLASYFLYLPLARVALAPFSEALSRKAHLIIQGSAAPSSPLGWRRAMWEGAKTVAFQLVVTIFVFALSVFIPVAAPVGILIAVFFGGLDYLDVPLSVRGLSLGKKLGVMWRNKSLALGFGAASYLSLLIPLVNLLSLPVGVVGATSLIVSLDSRSDAPEPAP